MRPTGTDAVRVVDSSVWIEHLADGALVDECAPYLAEERSILTPVQVLYEVYRWTLRHVGERAAMDVVSRMEATRFVPADVTAAIVAVDMSAAHELAAADAMIYATARLQRCELVTADRDFRDLPGVILLEEQTAEGDQP
jgi:predicted nucleic acid-binding protein